MEADEMFEKLGYTKYDNHPLAQDNTVEYTWCTQDCRRITYDQVDDENNREQIIFDFTNNEEPIVWINAVKDKSRIPAPLNFEEIEAIYKKFKELL